MNKPSVFLLIACTSLLSFTRAEAGGPVGKDFGGFTPRTEFVFTVQKRVSTRTKGTDVDKNVPIPDGIPDFHKGRKVRFTIGKKGQLTGPGFSIGFKLGKRLANVYADAPTGRHAKGDAATVAKAGDVPVGAVLTFYKAGFSGWKPVTYTVTYVLQ